MYDNFLIIMFNHYEYNLRYKISFYRVNAYASIKMLEKLKNVANCYNNKFTTSILNSSIIE